MQGSSAVGLHTSFGNMEVKVGCKGQKQIETENGHMQWKWRHAVKLFIQTKNVTVSQERLSNIFKFLLSNILEKEF